ncbi:4-(cytidine 5'-diphospho)-2-C-methyl-D-erythritol kinase [Campylobacter sp. FMV-PI01]|uniref:4-diphosphocytidyl-2-C-methyl-D-erythritol kinase n=1 Tax=Campylobacter portucalensis TaxID=2608384 RepID=A0A6L5WIC3_9BACT|nr:4-(cytidine 5'-diphospho)-2-C-methyl-D-erythritol kinase [Campylobacter portucalensis]MSN96676.1 4-(cytidine 5'-diphospho)-2-C-methyl-D-erythritol kinase [Campylobacter portucalensis]
MKSYAKINIFLKIVGTRGDYHEIKSRFVLFEELFDEIYFKKKPKNDKFQIISNAKIDGINSIQKAYNELEKLGFEKQLKDFFRYHSVILNKNIPQGGGLGGGSSNAATFLKMVNLELNLNIDKKSLMQISKNIGSDVGFFVSEFKSANVSGVGEIVEEFKDDIPNLSLKTTQIFSSTPKIYKEFRENFMDKIDINLAKNLTNLSSKEILKNYKNIDLNDLLPPFKKLNPNFMLKDDEFLSGSGSSYFYVKE